MPTFNPAHHIDSVSGLLDNVVVTVKKSQFEPFTFPGGQEIMALHWELAYTDAEGNDAVDDMQLSCGSVTNWNVTENGNNLVPTGNMVNFHRKCGLSKFVSTMVDQGFPLAQLESGKADEFIGMEFLLKRVPTNEKIKKKGRDGKDKVFDKTEPVCAKIVKLPKSNTGATPAAQDSADGGVTTQAIKALTEMAKANPNGVKFTLLTAKLVKACSVLGYKKQLSAIKSILTEDFINESEVAFVDEGVIRPV